MTIHYVKGIRCDKYFNEKFNKLDKSTLKKIKYLRKFLNTDKIDIICISTTTTHDGDYNYFKKLLVDKYKEVYYE